MPGAGGTNGTFRTMTGLLIERAYPEGCPGRGHSGRDQTRPSGPVRDAKDIVDELTSREVKLSIGVSVHDPTEADLIRARTRNAGRSEGGGPSPGKAAEALDGGTCRTLRGGALNRLPRHKTCRRRHKPFRGDTRVRFSPAKTPQLSAAAIHTHPECDAAPNSWRNPLVRQITTIR